MSAYPILFCSERMFTKSFSAICFFFSFAGRAESEQNKPENRFVVIGERCGMGETPSANED